MDQRLPWYRNLSAENRSWLGLVAQAGIAAFLDWIRHPERNRPAVTEVFGTAPRELARAVSLQHAVEMVRVIIDAVEAQVDELAAPGDEAELREAVLTYAREIAFSAALVYARTAEARGAVPNTSVTAGRSRSGCLIQSRNAAIPAWATSPSQDRFSADMFRYHGSRLSMAAIAAVPSAPVARSIRRTVSALTRGPTPWARFSAIPTG